jgi:hypothetical protein
LPEQYLKGTMPAGGRKIGTRNKDSRAILAALPEFLSPGRRVTVRYCLYQLVSRGLIASTSDAHYSKLSSLLRAVRVSGELDDAFEHGDLDACFVDNHCKVETWNSGFRNLARYQIPPDIRRYSRNRWQDQPKHPTEIWLEKDTTAVLIRPTVARWGCTLRISSGAFGRAFLVNAAQALAYVEEPITIFYIGDFDPKGLDIERAAMQGNNQNKVGDDKREGLFDILKKKHGWTAKRIQKQITWRRIAATHADLVGMDDKFKITAKQAGVDEVTGANIPGDTTAPAYVEQYGELCLEVEALEVVKVGELANRLDRAIRQYGVNVAAWNRSEAKERKEIATGVSIP